MKILLLLEEQYSFMKANKLLKLTQIVSSLLFIIMTMLPLSVINASTPGIDQECVHMMNGVYNQGIEVELTMKLTSFEGAPLDQHAIKFNWIPARIEPFEKCEVGKKWYIAFQKYSSLPPGYPRGYIVSQNGKRYRADFSGWMFHSQSRDISGGDKGQFNSGRFWCSQRFGQIVGIHKDDLVPFFKDYNIDVLFWNSARDASAGKSIYEGHSDYQSLFSVMNTRDTVSDKGLCRYRLKTWDYESAGGNFRFAPDKKDRENEAWHFGKIKINSEEYMAELKKGIITINP